MKKSNILLALGAALVLFGSAANAQEPVAFNKADTNADGMVDSAELAKTGVEKSFAELDKDGNGKLNKAEYEVLFEEECE
ncbi:MAG: calmodulin [Gammaproteobacteria bacterium]|nr:calmodulin [Gammaproteobacteria bacterium]